MKRIIAFIIILTMIVFCSCTAEPAKDFNSKSIENGYNNYLAGGNFAYKNGILYANFISDNYKTLGTYKFSNEGLSQILTDTGTIGSYAFETPKFYQYDNKIYVIDDGVFLYDETYDKLTKSKYGDIFEYISDDLIVFKIDNKLIVKYKDYPNYTIDNVYDCYVRNNIIYIINGDGWLYCNDVTKRNSESKFLNYLTESYVDFLHVCGDNVFFNYDASDYDKYETGLYCYSIKNNSYELVLKGEINCLNSFNDVLFIATDNGIFKYQSENAEKINALSAKEIYLLDKDWIYAVKNEQGNIYRVMLDGGKTEEVNFLT